MRWEDLRESTNVEDRRGEGGGMFRGGGGGGGFQLPIGGGGLSITSLLVIGAICLMLGVNPLELLSGSEGMPRMPDRAPGPAGTCMASPIWTAHAMWIRRASPPTPSRST